MRCEMKSAKSQRQEEVGRKSVGLSRLNLIVTKLSRRLKKQVTVGRNNDTVIYLFQSETKDIKQLRLKTP